MPTRGLTADRENVGTELLLAVLHQPGGSGFTIIGACWVRVFGCQTILHSDHGLARIVSNPFEHRILHICAAENPAATVKVQINPARLCRCDHA